jgi:hypothetical protein
VLQKTNTATQEIVARIRSAHRQRWLAVKIQRKLDRALESFVRINGDFGWNPDLSAEEREKINRAVKSAIKDARTNSDSPWHKTVQMSDAARAPADDWRKQHESEMETLAKGLPVWPWIEDKVYGVAELGLATIVAEAGDLARYPNVGKLWRRLGYAPYDGCAGSTWKRETWRPRALTKDEWIANPFSGERYALMYQIATWLCNAQWIGAAKTGTGEGKPDGPYGEVYATRRAHTLKTHPDWSDGHRRNDALRKMFKTFLADLWAEWNDQGRNGGRQRPSRPQKTKQRKPRP